MKNFKLQIKIIDSRKFSVRNGEVVDYWQSALTVENAMERLAPQLDKRYGRGTWEWWNVSGK